MRTTQLIVLLSLAVALGCGGKKDGANKKSTKVAANKDGTKDNTGNATSAPLSAKAMGFEKLYHLTYRTFGRGTKAFKQAERALRKARKQPDKSAELWKTVLTKSEAAIAGDPRHLDAHFTVALAKAHAGATNGLAENLSIALAGDWLKFGPTLEQHKELAAYLKGAEGRAIVALNKTYKTTFVQKATAGVLLVGRRSKFREPTKPGKQWSATRGELFSYDIESKRYLRLTHTKETVAAWLLSPSGDEIAYVTHNQVVWPEKAEDPPLLKHVSIGVLDTETFMAKGKRVHIYKKIHGVGLRYRAGDELIVAGLSTLARHKVGAPRFFVLDKGESKLRKLKTKPTGDHQLVVTYEWFSRPKKAAPHIQAESESSTFRLLRTKQTITLPEGEMVAKNAFAWSADGAHLAFHTMAKPCEGKPEATLYVVESATGKLKNLLRGRSEFGMRWLDNDQLIYEDTDGNLRIYNSAEQKQTHKLNNRAGLSLSGLASKRGPMCREDNVAKAPSETMSKIPNTPAADKPTQITNKPDKK